MSSYGTQSLGVAATGLELSADGRPEMKVAGITVDWATVAALGADLTLNDGTVIESGKKFLRYGQVMCLIGAAEVQTYTFTGGPTGGTATPTVPASGEDDAQAGAAIAATATAAAFQAALEGIPRIGAGGVTVARTGAGTAGDPYVYTATFSRQLGDVPQLTFTNTFTGGTTPTVTVATTTAAGATAGKYGPYDPAATDGRQTLSRGFCFLLNKSVLEIDPGSDHPPAMYGGLVYRDRLIATAGAASLAAGPTFTNLEAAFPRLAYLGEHD
jgi:hypothetical protein